jgi:hypothetical protein
MPHDDAETLDGTVVDHRGNAGDDFFLSHIEGFAKLAEGTRQQLQPRLQRCHQAFVLGIRPAHRALHDRACRLVAGAKIEAKIDVKLVLQRQGNHPAAGIAFDCRQCAIECRLIGRGRYKPQVVTVLALIIVIDFRTRADQRRDAFDLLRRRGQRGQR